MNVCQFLRPHNVGKRPFLEKNIHMNFEILLHMNVGLPGPLQTPFELKTDLPASTNEPDTATLTSHGPNWLKRPLSQLFKFFKI